MSTTMKAAFEKAGYRDSREEWPSEDLLQVAVRAMLRHADDTDACQHSIMRACGNDPALLRQLLLPWWRQATASLISEARRELRHRERTSALETPIERRAAKVVNLIEERELARERQEREEALAEQARLNQSHHKEFLARIAVWKQTKASSFEIEGRPFWEVSTAEARTWQRRWHHRGLFLDLLLSGVPEDDRPIMHYRRPEEIDALWDQAFRP
jgi:hypothetical protein